MSPKFLSLVRASSREHYTFNIDMKAEKKQREKEGAILKVPIDNHWHTYARIIVNKHHAFYDCKTDKDMSIDEILKCPVLFILGVYRNAVTTGRWKIIGYYPLEDRFMEEPTFFMQDVLNPSNISIYNRGISRPASAREVKDLERLAVWEAEHVESRLRDYYAGRPNIWVDSLKLKE